MSPQTDLSPRIHSSSLPFSAATSFPGAELGPTNNLELLRSKPPPLVCGVNRFLRPQAGQQMDISTGFFPSFVRRIPFPRIGTTVLPLFFLLFLLFQLQPEGQQRVLATLQCRALRGKTQNSRGSSRATAEMWVLGFFFFFLEVKTVYSTNGWGLSHSPS